MADRMTDEYFMDRAIMLAAKARGMTSPNPMVGAVIVKNGTIIAEDYHRKAGTPHAEALAISKAGRDARASTLYVSLEPCCHTDKRTPPCAKAIIGARVKRVVVAMRDPNPKVSGRGIKEMEEAGINVISGISEAKARRLNEFYIKYITTGRPFVTLKVAMTLDGKIATPEGQSKWITGERARSVVHKLRCGVDAVMTAIGTVRADDPQLTVRLKGKMKNPLRVVIDPDIETPLDAKILMVPPETIIVAKEPGETKKSVLAHKIEKLAISGISVIYFKEQLDLYWLMERLGERGITSLMIEGGSSLNAHALEDGIVDKVIFFIAPKIIGSRESFPAVGGKRFRRLEDAFSLKEMRVRRLGDDIMIEGYL